MKQLHEAREHDAAAKAEDEHLPSPEQITIAMTRALSNTLALARLCRSPRCRRSGRCKGDPRECLDFGETVLSADVLDGARAFIEGKCEGLSFDQVLERWPDQLAAYAHWIGRIAPTSPARKRQRNDATCAPSTSR